jgi:hypothetical protein
LVVTIPTLQSLNLRNNRIVLIEVSLNEGVDWTIEEIEYTFKPTPEITSLSHYESILRGDFILTIRGFRFESNIDTCVFGADFTSPGKHPFSINS